MALVGRSFAAGTQYRYGFNGQEKSEEIGEGLTTAMFWEYDSRIGRRWNVDPLFFSSQSPYVAFNNNPINNNDVSGLVARGTNVIKKGDTYSSIAKANNIDVDELKRINGYDEKKLPVGGIMILGGKKAVEREGGDRAGSSDEQSITDGVTSFAEDLTNTYNSIKATVTDNDVSNANAMIRPLAFVAQKVIPDKKNDFGWIDLGTVWFFELGANGQVQEILSCSEKMPRQPRT